MRQYFRKGIAARLGPHPIPQPHKPKLKGRVLVRLRDGSSRLMSTAEAARQLGRSRGGQAAQAKAGGGGRRFTETTGRAARMAQEANRSRVGYQRGRRLKPRPYVARAALREYYTDHPTQDISYHPELQLWSLGAHPITEKQALIRLGHLPSRTKGFVPVAVRPMSGTRRA